MFNLFQSQDCDQSKALAILGGGSKQGTNNAALESWGHTKLVPKTKGKKNIQLAPCNLIFTCLYLNLNIYIYTYMYYTRNDDLWKVAPFNYGYFG